MSYQITKIANFPTTIDKVHESVYRSYQILLLVERLLLEGTPGEVVTEIISELRTLEHKEASLSENDITMLAPDFVL
jgi:hypothetical protein